MPKVKVNNDRDTFRVPMTLWMCYFGWSIFHIWQIQVNWSHICGCTFKTTPQTHCFSFGAIWRPKQISRDSRKISMPLLMSGSSLGTIWRSYNVQLFKQLCSNIDMMGMSNHRARRRVLCPRDECLLVQKSASEQKPKILWRPCWSQ